MPVLESQSIDEFLRRFHRGIDARLRGMHMECAHGAVARVVFHLQVVDRSQDDRPIAIDLELREVSEMRMQCRPTQDPEKLVDGLAIGYFHDLFFVDLMPWTEHLAGIHDYRNSSCYAAGCSLHWEIAAE